MRPAVLLIALLAAVPVRAQHCEPAFHRLAGGMAGGLTIPSVLAMAAYDADGAGGALPLLYVGGNFTHADGLLVNALGTWNGAAWSDVNPPGQPVGVGGGRTNTSVHALMAHDADGTGPEPESLYVGGDFTTAGAIGASLVARWDGAAWSSLGEGLNWGEFAAWVRAFGEYDEDGDGPRPAALFVGGDFTHAGDLPVSFVARWDGAEWSSVGGGVNATVSAFAVYDQGDGPALYAVGNFTRAGGEGGTGPGSVPARFIARWDGEHWSGVGGGANATVRGLAVFDGGGASSLYAAGYFDSVGDVAASLVARWTAAGWSAVGAGLGSAALFPGVEALLVHDDGHGADLYATGQFQTAGGQAALNVARWNGFSWSALDGGIGPGDTAATGRALAGYGQDLYVGGDFISTGSGPALYVARWDACASGCPADLFPIGAPNGVVGRGDRAVLLANWGACPAPCDADLHPPGEPDGQVDARDLGELAAQWGRCND